MHTDQKDAPTPGKHTHPKHTTHEDGAKSDSHAKNDHAIGNDHDEDDAGATSGSVSGSGY